MIGKSFILLAFALIEVYATCSTCGCNRRDYDIFNPTPYRREEIEYEEPIERTIVEEKPCGCEGGPLVVRPAPNPKLDLTYLRRPKIICKKIEGGEIPLKPQASLCSCGTTIVKPAIVPRPTVIEAAKDGYYGATIFDSKLERTLNSASSSGSFASLLPSGVPASLLLDSNAGCDSIVENRQVAPAADAVSLSIALQKQLENNLAIVEDKLNFGFNKIPKNVEKPVAKPKPNIPEEDLYNVNGEVLELNVSPCSRSSGPKTLKDLEDEALEEILNDELEAEVSGSDSVALPSLTDLGYREAKYKPSSFVSINQPDRIVVDEEYAPGYGRGCAGYQPGQVIIKDIPVSSGVVLPPPSVLPCDDDVVIKKEIDLPPIVTYEESSSSRNYRTLQKNLLYKRYGSCY